MKKAFTLSEALVTLAIIAVLAAILIPVVNNVKPDKDKVSYKKALYTMQAAMSNAMDALEYNYAANQEQYWRNESVNIDGFFCEQMAETLNTAGAVDCYSTSSYDSPNFITTDGIRYWGLEGHFTDTTKTIYVDRNLSSGELRNIARVRGTDELGLKIRVRYDGKVDAPQTDDSGNIYTYENELVENSLQVSQGSY